MGKKMGGAKWALGLMILVLNLGAANIVNAMPCPDAIATLTPCVPFLLGLPPTPSDACCAGAQKLDKLASSSPDERKNLCKCIVGAIKSYPVNLEKVQQLPKLCKLQVILPSDPNIDCTKF